MRFNDYGHGITGNIEADPDAQSPIEGDEDNVKIVILHRRFANPSPECGASPEAVKAWAKANRNWTEFKLWMLDHSGQAYAIGETNPFSCPWDSGQAGLVFLRNKTFPKATREASAKRIVETFEAWANGWCTAYIIRKDGEVIDSCGGFYSVDDCEQAMHDAAAAFVLDAKEEAATAMAEAIQNERPDLTPA